MPADPFHDSALARLDQISRHERVLLLQGPNGPFFRQLARRLISLGATVTKINFNGGDVAFYPQREAIRYRDTAQAWPAFVRELIVARDIRAIVLFGQWRAMHADAIRIARELDIRVFVFEEGYARPWWITLEANGVNDSSQLRTVVPARLPTLPPVRRPRTFRWAFSRMALYSLIYFAAGTFARRSFPHYTHHKPFDPRDLAGWLRSAYLKQKFRLKEKRVIAQLLDPYDEDFFLVPLQINTDSQIVHASAWPSNDAFIEATIRSFAAHADARDKLVFKQHPLERGHADYAPVIARAAAECGVATRVLYIHDGHVPSLLKRSKGVVTVNSTVGLQALYHGVAVHVTGTAFYARPGLTRVCTLDAFWHDPRQPNRQDFTKFYRYMMHTTQINASFYAPCDGKGFLPRNACRRLALAAALLCADWRLAADGSQALAAWMTRWLH